MKPVQVYIVDDETDMLDLCRDILEGISSIEICTDSNGKVAMERLKNKTFDVLIVDLKMPQVGGLELFKAAKEADPSIVTIIITGKPTEETAVESIKMGVFDYLVKPFSPDQLRVAVTRAIEKKRLLNENVVMARQVGGGYKFGDIIGGSPAIKGVCEVVKKVSGVDVDVLITGESGTGKELIAHTIHRKSKRAGNKFVPVDCGAIPETLVESELYGHERGAFTDAFTSRMGLFELADGGTLFLDEICELSIAMQVKLLRAVQERSFRRIGSKDETKVNFRIIAATNRDIEAEVKNKLFREDLYYRINVARIDIPPLRERREDIPLLAGHFLNMYGAQMGREVTGIEHDAMEILKCYRWPGNVRQLQNVLKRILVRLAGKQVTVDDLPADIVENVTGDSPDSRPGGFFDLREKQLRSFEQRYLEEILASCQGDVTRASKEAKVPRGTFYRLLKKYSVDPDQYRK